MDSSTRLDVQKAFCIAIATMFKVMAGLAAFGLVMTFFTKEIPLSREVDPARAFKEREVRERDSETAGGTVTGSTLQYSSDSSSS